MPFFLEVLAWAGVASGKTEGDVKSSMAEYDWTVVGPQSGRDRQVSTSTSVPAPPATAPPAWTPTSPGPSVASQRA